MVHTALPFRCNGILTPTSRMPRKVYDGSHCPAFLVPTYLCSELLCSSLAPQGHWLEGKRWSLKRTDGRSMNNLELLHEAEKLALDDDL